jgi:hypothetical protein
VLGLIQYGFYKLRDPLANFDIPSMENPRLIQVGNTIINPDRIDYAERDKEDEVVVTFSNGEEKKFDGEGANFVWRVLSDASRASLSPAPKD